VTSAPEARGPAEPDPGPGGLSERERHDRCGSDRLSERVAPGRTPDGRERERGADGCRGRRRSREPAAASLVDEHDARQCEQPEAGEQQRRAEDALLRAAEAPCEEDPDREQGGDGQQGGDAEEEEPAPSHVPARRAGGDRRHTSHAASVVRRPGVAISGGADAHEHMFA